MSTAVVARRLSSLVRFEHTLFALPYAYVGAVLGADGWPGLANLLWITVAMGGARKLAMAINRLVDAEIDARNPRTARREIPAGLLSRGQVYAFCAASLALYAIAVSQLAPICAWLAPIPVVAFVVYPYLKRYTALCHLFLGAVTGRVEWEAFLLGGIVCFWIAGFDIIYATMDHEHDRAEGIHSIPVALGIAGALTTCRVFHGIAIALMVWVGVALDLGVVYYVGSAICAVLLVYENAIVRPDDLSRVNAAFFNVNAILAGIYLAAVVGDVAVS